MTGEGMTQRRTTQSTPTRWLRRAQPLLGTWVEVGVDRGTSAANEPPHEAAGAAAHRAIDAAFSVVRAVQAALSRFDPASDIARFNALSRHGSLPVGEATSCVLKAARILRDASDGRFDISLGTAPNGWCIDGTQLHKLSADARLDLGGIGKGHAVDCAVEALIQQGCPAGWVNAGGDLRAFGDAVLPIWLRDEDSGGARAFATLQEGAFATSFYSATSRSRWASRPREAARHAHVSVAAPRCLWADALTKIVAAEGDAAHPLLARFEAQGWVH